MPAIGKGAAAVALGALVVLFVVGCDETNGSAGFSSLDALAGKLSGLGKVRFYQAPGSIEQPPIIIPPEIEIVPEIERIRRVVEEPPGDPLFEVPLFPEAIPGGLGDG